MDLTKYEGGYLAPGLYWARIVKVEKAEANSGSRGLQVTFEARGKTVRHTFWQYAADGEPSPAVWRLAELAVSCGLSEEERRNFGQMLLFGRSCGIEVVPQQRNPQYNEVARTLSEEEYAAIGGTPSVDEVERGAGTVEVAELPPDAADGAKENDKMGGSDDVPF